MGKACSFQGTLQEHMAKDETKTAHWREWTSLQWSIQNTKHVNK